MMLALLLAFAALVPDSPTVAPPPSAPRPSVITAVDWARRPNVDALAALYPPDAWRTGVTGAATLSCSIDVSGSLTACAVVSEAPAGAGFGEAALKAASLYRLKPTQRDGQPASGGAILIPVRFPPPPLTFDQALTCYNQLHWHNIRVPGDALSLPWEERALELSKARAKETGVGWLETRRRLGAARDIPPPDDAKFSRCWDML